MITSCYKRVACPSPQRPHDCLWIYDNPIYAYSKGVMPKQLQKIKVTPFPSERRGAHRGRNSNTSSKRHTDQQVHCLPPAHNHNKLNAWNEAIEHTRSVDFAPPNTERMASWRLHTSQTKTKNTHFKNLVAWKPQTAQNTNYKPHRNHPHTKHVQLSSPNNNNNRIKKESKEQFT